MTVKEKMLEDKVKTLEQRLALVERFVELRFCETFRDFTTRNGKPSAGANKRQTNSKFDDDDDDEEGNGQEDYYNAETPTRSTRRTAARQTESGRRSVSGKSIATIGKKAMLKKCVVKLSKTPGLNVGSRQEEASVSNSPAPASRRYGTRRQTKISEAIIKREVDEDENISMEPVDEDVDIGDGASAVGADESYHENDGDDYFTYPEDQGDHVDAENSKQGNNEMENVDHSDGDWSGCDDGGDEDNSFNYASNQSNSEQRGTKRKKRGPYKKWVKSSENKKRKSQQVTSIKVLPDDTKIVSTDPTRGECPICKQHWKLEVLEQHIASHTKERHIKCPHCDKRYFKTDDLRGHIATKHNREKHFPKCRLCGVPVVRKMILHEKYCVKKALMRGDRKVDQSLLDSVRQECEKEGLEFVLPEDTVPPGVDPYERVQCPQCKKHFQRYTLDRHVKSHSLERNWKCTKCPKTYIYKHDLIRHMVVMHETSKGQTPRSKGSNSSNKGADVRKKSDELPVSHEITVDESNQSMSSVDQREEDASTSYPVAETSAQIEDSGRNEMASEDAT